MRRKRNKNNTTISSDGYIKKYFKEDIGRILVPNDKNLQNCSIPYVSHCEAESVLSDSLIGDPYKDKSIAFTGLTGSGKSTILRHVFRIERNGNMPYIDGQTVIIPVDFNRSQKSAQDAILSSLRVAIKKICNLYEIDYPDLDNQNFFGYVSEKREDFLELDGTSGRTTPNREKMRTFYETMPSTFASCQLQYVMDHSKCDLNLVVFVVDNIEAFMVKNAKNPQSKYLSPVIEAFKLADCISQRGETTKWCFNMVIACRHHIWRIMKGEFSDNTQESSLLQSYVTTEIPYDLKDPVEIDQIVEERERVFAAKQKDSERWNGSVKVVNTVLQSMENSIGDFILQIELKDIRKSFSKMQELILHRGLQKFQDEQEVAGAFQIDSEKQFDLSRVNIIKTLGLGNRKYYANQTSIIPNLLFNESKIGMELYPLLTLKYFLIGCSYSEPTWDNYVSISEFYETMKFIFSRQYRSLEYYFNRSIQFLLQHRLLLRSADQPQDEVPGLSLEEIRKIENVYVSGAAIVLWNELENSSALFQLFLDDIWLDEDSNYFCENGNDIEHCVKYLKLLYQTETRIYNLTANLSAISRRYYLENFGISPICQQLANGLIVSLDAIVASGDLQPQGRVKSAVVALEQMNELAQELQKWEQDRRSQLNRR